MPKAESGTPRWLYSVLDYLDGLSIPFWIISLGLVALISVVRHVIAWQSGQLPNGQFNFFLAFNAAFIFAGIVSWLLLDRQARQAFSDFRSSSKLTKAEEKDFISFPEPYATLVFLGGLVIGFFIYRDYALPLQPLGGTVVPLVTILAFMLGNAFPTLFTIRVTRQIVLIRRYLSRTDADIFNPGAVYAFSRYGASAAGIIFVLNYGLILLTLPEFFFSGVAGYALQFSYVLLMLLVFFVPLAQINGRMRRKKEELLNKIGEDQRTMNDKLHASVNSKNFAGLNDLRNAIAALKDQRDVVQKLPTWPWQPDTLRNLVTPLLIPVFVYLVQRFLGEFFGF